MVRPITRKAVGAAMKMDERVPKITPRIMAKEKPTDAVTTKDEDTQQHDQRGHGGVDGTCQGLVQRTVEQALTVTLSIQVEVLTDTVEDHHLIVDRVTDNGQDSTDEGLVNLE